MLCVPAGVDPEGYETLKEEWLQKIEEHSENPKVLRNAAKFFQTSDPGLAEQVLLKARDLSPDDAMLIQELAQSYKLQAIKKNMPQSESVKLSKKELEQWEEALVKSPTDYQHFYTLTSLVESASDAGEFARAAEAAIELLSIVDKHQGDWNFGNAIYHANYSLARVALSRNDIDAAADYLIRSSQTKGSPQLNSLGPDFAVASSLFELGKREAVVEYLKNCAKFWEMDMGLCQKWVTQIENSETPSFNRFDPKHFTVWKVFRSVFSVLRRKKKQK